MRTLRRYWFVVAAAAVAVYWWLTGDNPIAALEGFVNRGKRLTMMSLDSSGTVQEDLGDLVEAAGEIVGESVSQDELLLAILSASEHGNAGPREKALIQRVALNRVRPGKDLLAVLTSGNGLGKQGAQRQFSTARDAYVDDLVTARANLAGMLPDESAGALRYVHATGFRQLTDYRDVVAKWYAESGIVPVDVGDVSSLRIFLSVDKAREIDGLETARMAGLDVV